MAYMINGALKDLKDERDYNFEALGTSVLTDEEWEKGYDIENVIGYKIPVKNQYQSYSCVGQAYSYYRGILKSIVQRRYREVSAKSIYSLISLGFGQGAYLRDGAKTLKDLGAMYENTLKSYKDNGTVDETFMFDKSWFNEELKGIMELLKVSDYYRVTGFTIDAFAKAIRDGYGCVIGVSGNNNGSWTSKFPQIPDKGVTQNQIWGHALYAGKFKIIDGKKYIGVLNSWGNVGEDGWQWLGEEWFGDEGIHIFCPWLLIIKNKTMNETIKVLKDKNSSAVGFWLPAISEDVAKSYALNFGIEIPMKDGKIDWENFIQGEINFK